MIAVGYRLMVPDRGAARRGRPSMLWIETVGRARGAIGQLRALIRLLQSKGYTSEDDLQDLAALQSELEQLARAAHLYELRRLENERAVERHHMRKKATAAAVLLLGLLGCASLAQAQPQVTNKNGFAWDPPAPADNLDHYEVNFDFTAEWRGGGANDPWAGTGQTTQYPVPAGLSAAFHTFYVRACNSLRACSDPVTLGFVFIAVVPGVPGMPLGLRIVIITEPQPATVPQSAPNTKVPVKPATRRP